MGISRMAEWKTKTITLLHPIKVGELSLSSITLREPDLEAMEKIEEIGFEDGVQPTVKQVRLAIEALCGLDDQQLPLIKRLHKDDFAAVGAEVAPLLNGPTATDDGSASTEQTSSTSPATSAPS